jgi:uncharacterized membrane protein
VIGITPLLLVASLCWVALLVAAPLLPAAAAAMTYGFGALICHQLADRSFHLGAYQLPVCARCLGVYVGIACGAALAVVTASTMTRLTPRHVRLVLAGGVLPTAITVAAEWAGIWNTTNAERFAAGLPLGVAVAAVAAATLHYGECARRRPIRSPQPR